MPGTGSSELTADMLEIKSEQKLLNQRVESSISAMSSTLTAIQAELQGVKVRVEQLATAQSDFTHHSGAVERLAKAIEKQTLDNERRWEAHERENKVVSDRVTGHATGVRVLAGVMALVTLIVGGWVSAQKGQVMEKVDSAQALSEQRMTDHLSTGVETRSRYETRFGKLEADVRQLQEQRGVIRSP